MKLLSRAEEIILLAILRLKGEAYGISIRALIHESTGVEWSLASIYEPLNKLLHKGYVRKFKGNPLPSRGGRHKFLYDITREGKAALAEIYSIHESIWESVPKKSLS